MYETLELIRPYNFARTLFFDQGLVERVVQSIKVHVTSRVKPALPMARAPRRVGPKPGHAEESRVGPKSRHAEETSVACPVVASTVHQSPRDVLC